MYFFNGGENLKIRSELDKIRMENLDVSRKWLIFAVWMSPTTSDVLRKILKFSPFECVVASIGELYFIVTWLIIKILATTTARLHSRSARSALWLTPPRWRSLSASTLRIGCGSMLPKSFWRLCRPLGRFPLRDLSIKSKAAAENKEHGCTRM